MLIRMSEVIMPTSAADVVVAVVDLPVAAAVGGVLVNCRSAAACVPSVSLVSDDIVTAKMRAGAVHQPATAVGVAVHKGLDSTAADTGIPVVDDSVAASCIRAVGTRTHAVVPRWSGRKNH